MTIGSGDEATASPSPEALRVLLVDNNKDAADAQCALLKLQGYECRTVRGFDEALATVRSYRPHVIVLDFGTLPDDQAVARLRQEVGPVVLVAVTGYADYDQGTRSQELGFDSHLAKPVDQDELMAILVKARG